MLGAFSFSDYRHTKLKAQSTKLYLNLRNLCNLRIKVRNLWIKSFSPLPAFDKLRRVRGPILLQPS
jgi:hypothetical protein